MIETDKQRRWWFATHPEWSSGRHGKGHGDPHKVSRQKVDAYVDNAMEHADGLLADFLQSVKRHFGTEGKERPREDRAQVSPDSNLIRYASDDATLSPEFSTRAIHLRLTIWDDYRFTSA